MKPFSLFMSLIFLACSASAADELTGQPSTNPQPPKNIGPLGDREQAVNFYSKGVLIESDNLPLEGTGFVKLFRPRNRGHGSYDLIQVLQQTAAKLQEAFPSRDRLQIGDIARAKGGNISGHSSHQNGLDADIAFLRTNQTEQSVDYTGGFQESFVHNGKITANFDLARNWAFAKMLIATSRVQRIFVGEVVKLALCAHAKSIGEYDSEANTLLRLRMAEGHTDHFHIRVTCPVNSPRCQPQDEPKPVADGC